MTLARAPPAVLPSGSSGAWSMAGDAVDQILEALATRLKEKSRKASSIFDEQGNVVSIETTSLAHVGTAPGLAIYRLPDAEPGSGETAQPVPAGPAFPDKGEIVYAMGQGSLFCSSIKQVVTASGLWLYCVTPEGTTHWVRPEQVTAVNEKKGAADHAQYGGYQRR